MSSSADNVLLQFQDAEAKRKKAEELAMKRIETEKANRSLGRGLTTDEKREKIMSTFNEDQNHLQAARAAADAKAEARLARVLRRKKSETYRFLTNITVKDFLPEIAEIVTFNIVDSLDICIQTLVKQQLVSAPVYDLPNKRCVAHLDAMDVVEYLLHLVQDKDELGASEFKTIREGMSEAKLSDVVQVTGCDAIEKIYDDTHAGALINRMANRNVHRVALMKQKGLGLSAIESADQKDEILNIATQSGFLRFLKNNIKLATIRNDPQFLKVLSETKISDLGYDIKDNPVTTVRPAQTIFQCLRIMAPPEQRSLTKPLRRVAIVDGQDRLVGQFSYRDCIHCFKEGKRHSFSVKDIMKPVLRYQKEYAPNQLAPVVITVNDTVLHVMDILLKRKAKFAYILDDEGKPIADMSISQLFECCMYSK